MKTPVATPEQVKSAGVAGVEELGLAARRTMRWEI